MELVFIINAILFGVGLAMDAFSVSLVNGLNNPKIHFSKVNQIALVFGLFQTIMPIIGWFCVHEIVTYFVFFQPFIPWIALILLLYLGLKMFFEKNDEEDEKVDKITFSYLLVQGVATSIDALSVGFTIAEFDFIEALIESIIIGIVTYIICLAGVYIGKKFGTKVSKFATKLGGTILILIGLEIFIEGVFF